MTDCRKVGCSVGDALALAGEIVALHAVRARIPASAGERLKRR
jgi:hypothetical protein